MKYTFQTKYIEVHEIHFLSVVDFEMVESVSPGAPPRVGSPSKGVVIPMTTWSGISQGPSLDVK